MTLHRVLDDTTRDTAALYALDALPADATREFEEHLGECGLCRAEVRSHDGTVEALVLASPEAAPPPLLYDRLLARARAARPAVASALPLATTTGKTDAEAAPLAGFSYIRAASAAWMPSGVPGVTALPVQVDQATGNVTMLVRMEPGSTYPRHRHATTEECYVLQGDISAHGIRMQAGDYVAAEPATLHGVQSTEGGCLLLLIGSLKDEVLTDATP